jgi:hypothetical protein
VDELVSLLVKNHLYDDAITLCLAFKANQASPLIPVISGLVDRCCNLSAITAAPKDYDDNISSELLTELEIIKNNESVGNSLSPYTK